VRAGKNNFGKNVVSCVLRLFLVGEALKFVCYSKIDFVSCIGIEKKIEVFH